MWPRPAAAADKRDTYTEGTMNKLTEKTLATKVAVQAYIEQARARVRDEERGQGTVEYLGAVLLVVAIVGIVIAASTELGDEIVERLTDAVTNIDGGGEGGGDGGGGDE